MPPAGASNLVEVKGEEPSGFEWTEECDPQDDSLPDHAGCRCAAGGCGRGTCPCASAVLSADEHGRLTVLPAADPASQELTECGPSCSCFGACGLGFSVGSTAGGGSQYPPVSLHKDANKGWGVYADAPLPARVVVCQYAGEYITNAEAQRRLAEYDREGKGHALLVLREWLPSGTAAVRLNIDATRRGNLARFFNHACDGGNLQLMLGRRTGSLLPRAVFVTSRPVEAGEELSYSYGPPNKGPGGRRCFCGTPACEGFMPHEEV